MVVVINEELLLENSVSVADLGEGDLQRLGFQRTKAYSYRTDGEGNVYSSEGEAVRDEELEALVRVENYRVSVVLLEELSWNSTEQVDIFPDGHTHNLQGEVGSCTRKSHKNEGKEGGDRFRWGREQKFTCGTWRYAKCKHCGYKYWVRVPCSNEYCPQCGKPNSLYHRRLYHQISYVLFHMFSLRGALGYLVITCTEELREKWKDPNEMRKFMRGLRRKLKDLGLWPALYRWHWAGDRSRRWYPHLNLVFPLGYVDKEKLERLRRYLERRKGIKIIHYQYKRSLKKLLHLARYVSRPTWIMQDEVSPERFKGFKKWGVWGKELLGIKGRIKTIVDERKSEEFWLAFGVLVGYMVARKRNKSNWEGGDLDELVKKFLDVSKEIVGEKDAEKLRRIWESGGGVEWRVRKIVERVLKIRGWPELRELPSFVVLNGRCIGCFQKLKWKWRKSPFISSSYRVYKLGLGVWVLVDKEVEDEEFPF